MDSEVLNALRSQAAYMPGGFDRDEHHTIIVPVPSELHPWTKSQFDICINYILNQLRQDTKANGFTIVLDAQKSSWRVTRTYLRYVNTGSLIEYLRNVYIVRPESIWDSTNVESCVKTYKKGEPVFLTRPRLRHFFDIEELPQCLGGSLEYDHCAWITRCIQFEEFKKIYERSYNELENLHLLLLDDKSQKDSRADLKTDVNATVAAAVENGKCLLAELVPLVGRMRMSPDVMDRSKSIKDMLKKIVEAEESLEVVWKELVKNIKTSLELSELEEGVSYVTNFILNTAESLLSQQVKIGCDITTAEKLRKDHDALEIQCLDTYGLYAETLHKIQKLPIARDSYSHCDLMSQKEFMDFVCRSFATRLERRRNVLITSVRFFRLVDEYSDKITCVSKTLNLNVKNLDLEESSALLTKLASMQKLLDNLETEISNEGEKLSDMLTIPIKDALGREVKFDYSADLVNIRQIQKTTLSSKNKIQDQAEVQKVQLQQRIHIASYEIDLETTIQWLRDLFNVLVKSHLYVGSHINELDRQKHELEAFLATSKEIYDYGCHLLEASFILRQSSHVDIECSEDFIDNLSRNWNKLNDTIQEQLERIKMSTAFHKDVNEYYDKMCNIQATIEEMNTFEDSINYKNDLMGKVRRTFRLGCLLNIRLMKPLPKIDDGQKDSSNSEQNNYVARTSVITTLRKISTLAETLDANFKESIFIYDDKQDDFESLQNWDSLDLGEDSIDQQSSQSNSSNTSEYDSRTLENTCIEQETHSSISYKSSLESLQSASILKLNDNGEFFGYKHTHLFKDKKNQVIGGFDEVVKPNMLSWNEYYHNLLDEQTIKSCL